MGNLLFWLFFFTPGWALPDGSDTEEDLRWHLSKVPRIVSDQTVQLPSPTFQADAWAAVSRACGLASQQELGARSLSELEDHLSYETVFENGTRTLTRVKVEGLAPEGARNASSGRAPARRRRQVFGTDSRFSIVDRRFSTSFPFGSAVKLSTGCSGILVSPQHVLTAAHCVHDGQDYVRGGRRLRVGVLRARARGAGRRRRGPRRSGSEAGDDRAGALRAAGRGGRRRRAQARGAAFQWTRVASTQVPRGWARAGGAAPGLDFDYALLQLRRARGRRHMELGVSPAAARLPGGMIHFSGFDRDRDGQLVYRFCSVSDAAGDFLYQHCDAEAGSAGAGVYLRLRDPDGKTWRRKVIAVYSGPQQVRVRGVARDYNVAVRVTPLKFAQICRWVGGDDARCAYG
ncbi:inactive serine protease 35 [Nycticebus coucang]|uniref:inactive serine protease 35 n=1 Tax=Nycticebus coucang TaxID=9470 RepID=UPI00234D2AE6|nr:inactive serine protease 35 [Nycticebus coucang]